MIACCPHCSNNFYVSNEKMGTIVECSKCSEKVKVAANASTSEKHPTPSPAAPTAPWIGNPGDQVNVREGMKRLILVSSFLFGPIVHLTMKAQDVYTLKASFSEPVDNTLRFLILWGFSFTIIWFIYVGLVLLVKGFDIGQPRRQRRKNFRAFILLGVVSLLPLIPGVVSTYHYMSTHEFWYRSDVVPFFYPLPIAGFVMVWLCYLMAIYVGRGFRYHCPSRVVEEIRKSQAFAPPPAAAVPGGSWRSS